MMAGQPNILFICTDQQFAGAMSCAGNDNLVTPGMDRIAAAGMRFDRAYCTYPACVPARASFVTGLMPHQVGATGSPFEQDLLDTTIGNVLREGGYDAALAGKWHAPGCEPSDCGFDWLCPKDDARVPSASADYISAERANPFFLFASFINPHDICQVARGQAPPQGPVPQAPLEDCPALPANFAIPPFAPDVLQWLRRVKPAAFPTLEWTDDQWRHFRHQYYRLVEKVDAEIVRLLDALEASGKADNTVVIFTSDHGDGHGAHHWNQKTALWEEVIRIPMIVSGSGQDGGRVDATHLVSNGLDLLPTVCDYAGIECPSGRDGLSIRPLVEGGDGGSWRDELVVETEIGLGGGPGEPSYALVTDSLKYSVYVMGSHREQMVDLNADPGEMVNLAVESRHAETLSWCRNRLGEWCERTDDPGVRIIPEDRDSH